MTRYKAVLGFAMRVLQAKTKRPLDLIAIGSGGHVAAASSAFGVRGDVDVWDIASGKVVLSHAGSSREVHCIAFSPGGKHLFIGTADTATVLDMGSQNSVTSPKLSFGFPEFSFSSDGSRLLMTESVNENSTIKCFAVDAQLAFLELWAVKPIRWILYGDPVFSPDAKRVAVSMHDGNRDRVGNNVQVRDAATGRVQFEIEFGASDPIEEIAFSADGSKVLARSSGRTVKVFDAANGQPAGELLHPGRPYVTGMAIHPNGTVACTRNNGTVCLWNLDKRELVRALDWKLGKLVSVAFSPDGSIGAAGTEDGQVIVWDVD